MTLSKFEKDLLSVLKDIRNSQERIADFFDKLHVTPKGRPSLVIMPKPVGHEKVLFERMVTALEQSATARLQEAENLTE